MLFILLFTCSFIFYIAVKCNTPFILNILVYKAILILHYLYLDHCRCLLIYALYLYKIWYLINILLRISFTGGLVLSEIYK